MSMFEAYSVAVRIRMIDGLTTGLLGYSRLFGRVHGQAAAFHHQLNRIALTAAGGLGMVALGAAMLGVFRGPMHEAQEYESQLLRLRALGNGPQITGEARHFSDSMRVNGVTRNQNLEIMTDAMMITRSNLHEAEQIAPRIARVQAVLEGMYGMQGRETARELMNLMRSAEFRGGLHDAATMNRELDIAMRFITMSGNRIRPTDLMQFMKFGGVAATALTPEAIIALEPLLQEMGGMRLGTSLQTTFNRLQIGQGLSGVAGTELMRYGLIDPNQVTLTPEGRFRRFRPGSHPLIQSQLAMRDPARWIMEVMFPTARAHGASDEDLIRLGVMAGGRTGGQIFGALLRAPHLSETARAAGLRAWGIDEAYSHLTDSQAGKALVLQARYQDLMLEFGLAVLPLVNDALATMIPMMERAAAWAHANPATVKAISYVLLTIGGLAMAGGTMLLLGAAFSALGLALQMVAPALNVFRIFPMLFRVLGGGLGLLRIGLFAIAGIIGWPAALIAALAVALTALGVWLYNNVEPFRVAVDGIIAHLSRLLNWLGAQVAGMVNAVERSGATNNVGPNPLRGVVGLTRLLDPDIGGDAPASPYVRGSGNRAMKVYTEINMDGRRVASAVSDHQSREAQRPPTGASHPNGRAQPMPVAAGAHR